MAIRYEGKGDTRLLMAVNLDGTAFVNLTNSGWSIDEGRHYDDLEWSFDGRRAPVTVVGSAREYRNDPGFTAYFPSIEIAQVVANASKLIIYRGGRVVDDLSLAGSGAAVAMMRRCLADLRPRWQAAERQKHRFDHITDDPFRSAPTSEPGSKVPFASFFSTDDYPPAALRLGVQGNVTVRLAIGSDGRATNCTVTASSSSSDLDAATCRVAMRRGRFAPATDGASSLVDASYNWKLPPR